MTLRLLLVVLIAYLGLDAQPKPDGLTILYTGKLLGYARTPDIQRVVQTGWLVNGVSTPASGDVKKKCAAPKADCQRLYKGRDGGETSAVATVLSDFITKERAKAPGALLLGMGDNFAMDYFSRVVVAEMYGGGEEYIGKDELFYDEGLKLWIDVRDLRDGPALKRIEEADWAGNTRIPSDNVATFLSTARYNALVPGKHDFYYGPERLRQLARLAAVSGTQMLAANLILQSKPAEKAVQVEERIRAKERNFETAAGDTKWSLPRTVLPWARKFKLKSYRDAGGNSVVDPSESARLCAVTDRDHKPDRCDGKTLTPHPNDKTNEVVYTLDDATPIQSELTYLLCVRMRQPKTDKKPDLCVPVDVSTPFFQYPDVVARKPAAGKETEKGYAGNRGVNPNVTNIDVHQWLAREDVVVMGVVEPGLETLVGAMNTAYINKDKTLDTGVVAIDPGEALTQLLDFCERSTECQNKPTVLMAQMPRDEAAILNDRMGKRFTIVLAQADGRFATAPQAVTYSAGHHPIVLVPRELMEKDPKGNELESRVVQLNVATLTGFADPANRAVTTRAVAAPPIDGNGINPCDLLISSVSSAWTRITGKVITGTKPEQHAERFRTVVLHALREALHADVALIQDRDFYNVADRIGYCQDTPVSTVQGTLQASIEEILWKGDFAISRTITGAALKSALKESQRLKTLEENSYAPPMESHRWLQTLGVWQDSDTKTWYINGTAVDDKTAYSVAITDFLASGDTGYSDLKDPAVPPATRPRDMGQIRRLSATVLPQLSPDLPPPPPLRASSYLDGTQHGAFPQPEAAGFWNQAIAIFHALYTKHPNLSNVTDRLGQSRPFYEALSRQGRVFVDGLLAQQDYSGLSERRFRRHIGKRCAE